MPTKKSHTVTLYFPQKKKHVTKYETEDSNVIMTNAYVNNTLLEELGNPEKIKVTVEAL